MSDESKQWLGYHENPTFTKSTEGWSMTNEQESAGEFLRRVGTDGYKWSQEMAERFNLPQADLLGWCCNMIEVGRSAGEQAARANSGWLQPNEADVVELIKAAIWANSTPDDCSKEAVERVMGEAAQAALRALTDAGYNIVKRG